MNDLGFMVFVVIGKTIYLARMQHARAFGNLEFACVQVMSTESDTPLFRQSLPRCREMTTSPLMGRPRFICPIGLTSAANPSRATVTIGICVRFRG